MPRITRREMIHLSVLAVGGSILAACAPTAAPTSQAITAPVATAAEQPTQGPTAAPQHPATTLRLWHLFGGNRVPLMEEQVKRFQATYPWATVELSLMSWDDWIQKIQTSVATGDPADAVFLGREFLPAFVDQDMLLPIDDYMARDGIRGDMIYPAEFKGCQYKGKTWILPVTTGGAISLFFWNKDWFRTVGLDPDKAPQTWAELEEASKKLTVLNNGTLERIGFTVLMPGSNNAFHAFTMWMYADGGSWISEDLKKVQFNSAQGLETLKWMAHITQDINGGQEEVAGFYSQSGEWENGPFYNNFEAMKVDGSWDFFKLQQYAPNMNWGLAPIPHGPSGESHGEVYGGYGYVTLRGAKQADDSWLLVKFFTGEKDGGCWFDQTQGRPSPWKACNEDPAAATGRPYWPLLVEIMGKDTWVPISQVQPKIEELMSTKVDQALRGDVTPEQALQSGADDCQKLIDEYAAGQS